MLKPMRARHCAREQGNMNVTVADAHSKAVAIANSVYVMHIEA